MQPTEFPQHLPDQVRKCLGVYYTNDAVADLLARLAVTEPGLRVIDPACGCGVLLLAAAAQMKRLWEGQNGESFCQWLLTGITGIEIFPPAAQLAAQMLSECHPSIEPEHLRIGVTDSMTLTVDSQFPSWTQEGNFPLGQHDVVVMNPPFTRGHSLSKSYKRQLAEHFSHFPVTLKGYSSLQAYFLLLAFQLLQKGGTLATVIPTSTFATKSHQDLTQFFLQNMSIDYAVFCRGRSAFSDQTQFREMLLVARKVPPIDHHVIHLAVINPSPSEWTNKDISSYHHALLNATHISQTDLDIQRRGIWIRRLAQDEFLSDPRAFYRSFLLTTPLFSRAYQFLDQIEKIASIQRFNQVFHDLGVAYRINPRGSFARGFKAINFLSNSEVCLKSNDVWMITKQTGRTVRIEHRKNHQTIDIPKVLTLPCFRRFSGLKSIDSTKSLGLTLTSTDTSVFHRLLSATFPGESSQHSLTKIGENLIPTITRCRSHLILVYKLDLGANGTHILATVSNTAAYAAGDAWIFPNLSIDDARIIATWFNSTMFLIDLLTSRTEQRGTWMRFDRPILQDLRVLHPLLLSPWQKKELTALYNEIAEQELPPLRTQLKNPTRLQFDQQILRILGENPRQAMRIALLFNDAAKEAIYDLLTTMKGD